MLKYSGQARNRMCATFVGHGIRATVNFSFTSAVFTPTTGFLKLIVAIKDHIEKIDFQELIFACCQLAKFRIVQNCTGICLYNTLHWLVCYKPTGQCFPDFVVWVSVDFYS